MDSIIQAIGDWLKEVLVAGIMSNLNNTFDSVNYQVGQIATEVGMTPSSFSPAVFNMIRNLSENVIMPIAGILLTFIACYELIQLIMSHNNLANFETWIFWKWIFKTFVAVTLISNTMNITMAVFDVAQYVVTQAGGIISGSTAIDASTLATMQSSLEAMEVGPLLGIYLQSFVVQFLVLILSALIFVIVYGRMIEILLEEKSILLKYSSGMPWRNQLITSVVEAVKVQNSDKKFVDISNVEDLGKYLLKEFCKPEKRTEYRPSKGYAKFFAESDDIVLHDRYLWIKVIDQKNLEDWLNFVSEYIKERGKKTNNAVFILECAGEMTVPVKKGIKSYSIDDYIGEYDRIVFAVLAASSLKNHPFINTYLSELVANVAGNDIELAAECIKAYNIFLENPLAFIRMIVDEKMRSDGEGYEYTKNLDEVNNLIWLSQIKTIYPRLEEYREDFVQRHYSSIAKQLPIQASYGETYNDPKDVELGTLMYMIGCGCFSLNTSEYEKLKKYKEARNKLSHLTALSISEIKDLL